MTQTMIQIPMSPGELLDKISILEIKADQIKDPAKLHNVKTELALLLDVKHTHIAPSKEVEQMYQSLKTVNKQLWDIEDDIRDCERKKRFDQSFIDLARAVYITNDKRCEIKRDITTFLGSTIIEEKSYQPY